jgi:hypothetical protein
MAVGDWATWGRVVLRAATGRPSVWRPATGAAPDDADDADVGGRGWRRTPDVGVLVATNQGGAAATAATDALVGRLIAWHRGPRVGPPPTRGATRP